MSMENAILAHAAALTALAEAIRSASGGFAALSVASAPLAEATTTAPETKAETKTTKATKADPKPTPAPTEAPDPAPDADTTSAAAGDPDTGTTDDEPTLDYAKDVKPKLLAAIKKAGKEKVSALIQTYGVAKAEQIDPAHFADLLAKAEAL